MTKLVLFCKSYAPDMLRARRLVQSVGMHNRTEIPFYVSVPAADFKAFAECLQPYPCHLLTDEEILGRACEAFGEIPSLFPSHLKQQLIKLEFWRMGGFKNFVWLDSDSYFIKPFAISTFLNDDGVPYTVRHDNRSLLKFADQTGNLKIKNDFFLMAAKFRDLFGRQGPLYSFASPPLVWSCEVLRSLHEDYLSSRQKNIYDLLERYPCEMHLYGEYLHYSKVVPVVPREEYFKVYHYPEQFFMGQELGETEHELARDYYGIIIQSNWARLPGAKRPTGARVKTFLRKAARQLRDLLPGT